MIIPGLLTASTNKAAHLGISTDRVACLSIVIRSFRFVVLVFGLKHAVFPLRSEVGTRVGARPTQALPERSGGLGGLAESCRAGSRGTIRNEEAGKLKKAISSRLEWSLRNDPRGLIEHPLKEHRACTRVR